MSPIRRTVLRSGGALALALLAGCLGGVSSPDQPSNPSLSLVNADADPDLPVSPAVEVNREVATDDHPPQLRVTVTNAGDEVVHVGEGRAIVFAYVTDDSNALQLLPADGDYPAEAGCWRLTDGIAITEEYRTITLDPGETTTQLVDLYGAPGGDGCLPTGEFRFESTYSVTTGEDAVPGGSEGSSARWGFSVRLS